MKYIVIVPDGMADLPVEELGNKTPLEAANTTNFDHLASRGMTGLIQTIPEGMPPGSDIGNMALLGYDPRTCHTGRAPLEAANLGINLADDEIAVRTNLITINDGKMADYSAGHITTKEADSLIQSLNDKIDLKGVRFVTGKNYRHLLILKVTNPSIYMALKTTPPHDILNKDFKEYLPRGEQNEMLLKLMERSKEIFENHEINKVRLDLGENPANMIWLWGQGTKPQLPSFQEKFGVRGGIISAVDLVNGIGKLAGLEVIDVPNITGYYDTNYKGKAEYALKYLKKKRNDFVYIHIESPDEAGHNGHIDEKVKAIESIDRDILGTILNHYHEQDDVRILVLPDHPTPVELRTHTNAPVPFVISGKGIAHDGSVAYEETKAIEKGVAFESGEELMEYFMKRYI